MNTRFLILDTESIPDGELLVKCKYPGFSPEEAIRCARNDTKLASLTGSDFIPVTFQAPIAVAVAKVGEDFTLQEVRCLDAPQNRPVTMVGGFFRGIDHYPQCDLVTFNGRGFDLPLLELAAYRYGIECARHLRSRDRYRGYHVDLMEWFTNFGGYRINGGLNVLAKLIGCPGKRETTGADVYDLYLAGKIQEINDYCMSDVLDTYFVFLRTRTMLGCITIEQEKDIVRAAKEWMQKRSEEVPAMGRYLENLL